MNDRWEYGDVPPNSTDVPAADGATNVPAADGATDPVDFPWPPSEGVSVVAAFGETWKSATFDPREFFRRIPRDDGTGAALLYYLALVMVVAGATLFWESLSLFALPMEETGAGTGLEAVNPLVGFLLTPVILLFMLGVSTAITHMLLSLFDGARHGFGTTLRVFSYAYSPGLFGVIPIIGGVVGSIWMVVLLIIGLREAHETDGWKAAVAVLLPFALLMGLLVLTFMMFLAAGAALFAA